jgi:hypothetical protein
VSIPPCCEPGYGRRMRDGAPLPGRTPAQVLSQLAHRVFGPLQPSRTRIVLDLAPKVTIRNQCRIEARLQT